MWLQRSTSLEISSSSVKSYLKDKANFIMIYCKILVYSSQYIWLKFYRSAYKNENYVVLGGVQDKNKANNLSLLLYKLDTPNVQEA